MWKPLQYNYNIPRNPRYEEYRAVGLNYTVEINRATEAQLRGMRRKAAADFCVWTAWKQRVA